MFKRGWAYALLATSLSVVRSGFAEDVRWDYRVAVSTTSLDGEREVEESLERNVNRLGAAGYEVVAISGGVGPVLDELLARKAASGSVDHSGHVLVILARPAGRPAPAREYRLLHTRRAFGVDALVAPLGPNGFRLVATAAEGGTFHAAFEKSGDSEKLEYRVYANKGRATWMEQVQNDPDALARLRRVAPMGLDHALVELGPAPAAPGALEWIGAPTYAFSGLETKLKEKANGGFRVQLVRLRGNNVDVLLVRPAGPAGPPALYDLDDGPWASPCGRGSIVGADVYTDGDTFCAAENPGGGVSNHGLDLTLRAEPSAGGRLLFRAPDCEGRARLGTSQAAGRRLAVARQLEQELESRVDPGYRVTRVLAAVDGRGAKRLSVFTTNVPSPAASGGPRPAAPASLVPDRDAPGETLTAQREAALNAELEREESLRGKSVWVEVSDSWVSRSVRISGCVPTSRDREEAETVVRRLLVTSPFSGFKVRNEVVVDR